MGVCASKPVETVKEVKVPPVDPPEVKIARPAHSALAPPPLVLPQSPLSSPAGSPQPSSPKSYRRPRPKQDGPVDTTPRSITPRTLRTSLTPRISVAAPGPALPISLADSIAQTPKLIPVTPRSARTIVASSPRQLKWIRGEEIGRGAMGVVYQGLLKDTGTLVAVKEVFIKSEEDDNLVRKILEEVKVLESLDHPNIVKLLAYQLQPDYLEIVLEFIPGGSISSVLKKFGPLGQQLIRKYLLQVIHGLAYLHARDIAHRDLKSANILLTGDGSIKLADFGCSKRIEKQPLTVGHQTLLAQTIVGSVPWMAPEVLTQTGHTTKADIWSLGCVAVEMLTGKIPWGSFDNTFAVMLHIAQSDGGPPIPGVDGEGEEISRSFRDLLEACFKRDPKLRASAAELETHAFFEI